MKLPSERMVAEAIHNTSGIKRASTTKHYTVATRSLTRANLVAAPNAFEIDADVGMIAYISPEGQEQQTLRQGYSSTLGTASMAGLGTIKHNPQIDLKSFATSNRIVAASFLVKYLGSTLNNMGSLYIYKGPNLASEGANGVSLTLGDVVNAVKSNPLTIVYDMPELRKGIHMRINEIDSNRAHQYHSLHDVDGNIVDFPIHDNVASTDIDPGAELEFEQVILYASGMVAGETFLIDYVQHNESLPHATHTHFATPTVATGAITKHDDLVKESTSRADLVTQLEGAKEVLINKFEAYQQIQRFMG